MEKPYKVETRKIPKGTKQYWLKLTADGKREFAEWTYPTDFLAISGDCSICHQFPCKHTNFVMKDKWQKKEKAKVFGNR